MTDGTPPPGKSSIIQNAFVGKHDMVLLVLNSFQVAKASHISFIRMIDGNLIFWGFFGSMQYYRGIPHLAVVFWFIAAKTINLRPKKG